MKKIVKITYKLDDNDRKSIKKQMIDLDINYLDLATKMNISESYLYMILNGDRVLTPKMKERFEDAGIKLEGGEK